jgi:hypothetical protein
VSDLILINGEAFTPDELERRRRKIQPRARTNAAYWRDYRRKRGESLRAYQREYQRVSRVLRLSDDELRSKIDHHQRLIDRYSRELELRSKEVA